MNVNPTHVNSWLDDIGASEDRRKLYWDNSMIKEIGDSVIHRIIHAGGRSQYIFGSFSEGTTTNFHRSDIDFLICEERYPVINNIKDATAGTCFLMASDCSTKPGYVKLQKVINGVTQTIFNHRPHHPSDEYESGEYESDEYGRICLKHMLCAKYPELTERHGPADTIQGVEGDIYSNDFVYALRCKQLPCFANSWRPQHDWPSQKQLKKMGSYGCFLVGVTHPNSHNKSIEWRISFSLQERELMPSLNPTQHRCYILLKMIKNELIEPVTGKSISSYHCKTCLFSTIESSGSRLWTEENIIECLHLCLNRLLRWSKTEHCPNYFIPEENMFDKVDGQTLQKVQHVLSRLLSRKTEIFSRLTNFNYYKQLYEHGSKDKRKKGFQLIVTMHPSIYTTRNVLLKRTCKDLDSLQTLLRQLQLTDQVTEHTPTDVRLVLSYIIPHIYLQIAQGLASVKTNTIDAYQFRLLPLNILHTIMLSSVCDLISSRLSLAATLQYVGMFDESWLTLQAAEDSLTPHIISVCQCNMKQRREIQCELPVTLNPSVKDIIQQHIAGCMVYLQQHANIAHPYLQFEMYRSVYIEDGSRHDIYGFCFDWIVVDSKVYLYFLQCVFCIKANKSPVWRNSAMEKLRHVIEEDKTIGHRETAYNLLGCILVQGNRSQEAWQCLCRSWRIRPHYNAAKWHLVLLLNDVLQ